MSWLGKFLGGAFGFMLGGPLGAILGASLGHQFDIGMIRLDAHETLRSGDQHRVQMAFFTATFSVMGHIAKADGQVSPEEISLANRIMDQMSISGEMRTTAVNLFQQGKGADFPLDDILAQFYRECHRRTDLIRMFLEIQMQEALADGSIVSKEEKLLLHICGQLRVSRFDYERLKIRLQAQQRFYGRNDQYQQPRRREQSSLQDAYGVLGLTPSASDAEAKKAYRRLMSQNHPDKLVAKGLPEEMMKVAKEKTQKITKAYEAIQQARKK
ncbi:co-chaperone DjlA [Methyloglobulus sp.]|uniref:co-chaperone DjlA n=1 Tax=Methyloglobulus sp. TaxID=2518622 RepID=UPI0039892FFF